MFKYELDTFHKIEFGVTTLYILFVNINTIPEIFGFVSDKRFV